MAKYWETKKFKEESEVWEQKLKQSFKASGDVDIEKTVNGERVLSQRAGKALYQAAKVTMEAKATYFQLLTKYVSETKFLNEIDKLIMTKRSEGMSIKNILLEIEKLGKSKHRETVRFIIRRYENEWKIRKWTLQQMNLRPKPATK